MSKRKAMTTETEQLPTVEQLTRASTREMADIRDDLISQRILLQDRRSYLGNAIKQIDSHVDIIDQVLRMIESNQR